MKKTITSMFMMILLITGSSYSQDKQDWKFMHPTPQNNIVRKAKMVSETNWVAAGANGSFLHSSNSGANWYFQFFCGKVTPNTLATTQNYDMWFFDESNGIVVGDQGYIGRTANGGVTFDTAGSSLVPSNSRNSSIWFADANTGYIGSGSQNAFTTTILKQLTADQLVCSLSGSVRFDELPYCIRRSGCSNSLRCLVKRNHRQNFQRRG
ncbi:MAG: hypothetical protein IPL53_03470 [Ignavibacteria bacterium]|nr:hypothetical protein [Ignavibacteria bacterium]